MLRASNTSNSTEAVRYSAGSIDARITGQEID
jgi:hypothetical protein